MYIYKVMVNIVSMQFCASLSACYILDEIDNSDE